MSTLGANPAFSRENETQITTHKAEVQGGLPAELVDALVESGILGKPDDPKHLPTNAKARKMIPLASGLMSYFPDALIAVAVLSFIGNQQHNPDKPLHWDRSKSGDEWDCLERHFMERGTFDTDKVRHSAKVAWRSLAGLQKEIEAWRESNES